jgi:uncharacterized membrane protein
MSVIRRFKSYFLHRFGVLSPVILAIWIFIWVYKLIQDNISISINRGFFRLVILIQGKGDISEVDLNTILWKKLDVLLEGVIPPNT